MTAWFNTNKKDVEARKILYPDFPKFYTWNKNTKKWSRRKYRNNDTIGRVYMAHPSEGEKYYLRMLLYFVPGATSFEELRTFNNNILLLLKKHVLHIICYKMMKNG